MADEYKETGQQPDPIRTPQQDLASEKQKLEKDTKQYLSYQENIRSAKRAMSSMERNWEIPVLGPVIKFFQKGKYEELQAMADASSARLKTLSESLSAHEKRIEQLKKFAPKPAPAPDLVRDLKELAEKSPEKFKEEILTKDESFLRENYNEIWDLIPEETRKEISEKFPAFGRDFCVGLEGKDALDEMVKQETGKEIEPVISKEFDQEIERD